MNLILQRFLILTLLILCFHSCNRPVTYYVSPSGDDSASGTESQPVASIAKALELARNKQRDATVVMRQGTYYLTQPVVFTPEDRSICITARAGEEVIVSGGALLQELQWQPFRGDIMQAEVRQDGLVFDQLFVDGWQQPMARYPNYDASASHYNGTAVDALSPERVKRWKNPAGGYIHALHRHEWGGYHWLIKGKNDHDSLLLEGGYQNNRLMGMHEKYRFVENIFEELDAPGEWFYDVSEKKLYFYPPEGLDLAKARVETPQLRELFVVQGSADRPAKDITIEGLTLTHTLRTFMDTREPLSRSDWAISRSGAIRMEGAEHCSVKDCYFDAVGGNAVFFSNYNRDHVVSGCHIEGAGASGVCFVGDPKAVRSPSFEYNEYVAVKELDTVAGPAGNNYPARCMVYDNLMHDLGRVEKQVAGVQISMSQDITVSHNSIYNVPRAGVNISEGAWGGHVVEYNDVFNTVLETGDHGSFNSWGRDRYWHPNRDTMDRRVARHPELILLDAVKTTVIHDNRFRCDHGWDIDLDDGSSNYHIYNNVCLNGGIKLREGFYRTVENNIMINNSFHPHVWFRNSGDVFRNNIVMAPYYPIRVDDWGKEVDYNFFPGKGSLVAAQKNGTDLFSLSGKPEFVNPAVGDYRVDTTSKAVNVGFKNFDMDDFGVVSPRLKEKARKPDFPELVILPDADIVVREAIGMMLKNVTTLGERSAAGLSETTGVWVVEVLPRGRMNGILLANDVILEYNHKKIRNMNDLAAAHTEAWQPVSTTVPIVVWRNQKRVTKSLTLPPMPSRPTVK